MRGSRLGGTPPPVGGGTCGDAGGHVFHLAAVSDGSEHTPRNRLQPIDASCEHCSTQRCPSRISRMTSWEMAVVGGSLSLASTASA